MMVGRKEEKEKLLHCYDSQYSQFVAIHGRKGSGKTYLVNETFNHTFTFTHTAPYNATKDIQIKHFCSSLQKAGYSKISDKNFTSPSTWLDAFFLLELFIMDLPKEKRKVIFIDEISWMDTQKSDLVTALESFWNGFASSRKDILLIISSSSSSWILDNVIHNIGGLYNRLNCNIKLSPFSLSECKELIKAKNITLTDNQIIECYMIWGGLPYFWSLLDNKYSLYENIDSLFFNEKPLLQREKEYIYAYSFKNPKVYLKLLKAFCNTNVLLTREELIASSNVSNNAALTKRLQDLETCGFIRTYKKFGTKNKKTYYQLIDNFTFFYFSFLEEKQEEKHFWENHINTPMMNEWSVLAYERVCLAHILEIKKKIGISGVITEVCSWSCKKDSDKGLTGSQINLLIVRKDQEINLCEIKYSNKPYTITKEDFENIVSKVEDIYLATSTKYTIHKTVITLDPLIRNSYSDSITSIITAEDLFQ